MITADPKTRNFMAVITADHVTGIDELQQRCEQLTNAKYVIIRHDKDIASDHYHIGIAYDSPRTLSTVAAALQMPSNFIQKWDSRVWNLWGYLTHTTTDATAEKYAYNDYVNNPDKCRANFDYAAELRSATTKLERAHKTKLDGIVAQILDGTLTKRDLLSTPDGQFFYWKNLRQIDNAIRIRTQSLQLNPPACSTVLITGPSSSGKTTLADKLARFSCGASVAWASSANDPLQDYQGERCIIFDDFRPQDYDWVSLLALLDPFYRQRTHTSRYFNKPLATELIILTTVLSIDDIVRYYDMCNSEDKRQLRRRIQTIYNLGVGDDLVYNEVLDTYEPMKDDPFPLINEDKIQNQ